MKKLVTTYDVVDVVTQVQLEQSTSRALLKKGQGIVIVGGSGAGKTTLGKQLANIVGLPFVDSDNLVEFTNKDIIANIFRYQKEIGFRYLEAQTIRNCIKTPSIISLGAGAWENAKTRELVYESGFTAIWLTESPDIAWLRVAGDQSRPLVTTYDQFLARWNQRIYAWSTAIKISPSKMSPYYLAEKIARQMDNS
jgi:shikimate kinase